jgi:RNA polymerase sigma-70 factor (ECF subfamily)
MDDSDPDRPLNRISTLWTLVCQAQAGPPDAAGAAQRQLLERYRGAVYRYLLAAVREADAAEDLAQEFALRFIQGKLGGADPALGRFRDYLKGVLAHLIADHHRRRPWPLPLPDGAPEPVAPAGHAADDRQFLASWRQELLARTWEALAAVERRTGQPFHTVLEFRRDHPELRSAEMAERLGARLGKPLTAPGVRQTLRRARDRFADLLLDEVAQTLRQPTVDQLGQELAELELLQYCQAAFDRYRAGS